MNSPIIEQYTVIQIERQEKKKVNSIIPRLLKLEFQTGP